MSSMTQNILRNLFARPSTRVSAPEPRGPAPDYRGTVEFSEDDCSYCGACALRCPAEAIDVDRAARTLHFDLFRCVNCACCVEACRKGCVQMRSVAHAPVYTRPDVRFQGAPVLAREGDDRVTG